MKKSLYSVYDVKGKTYDFPFAHQNHETALRAFHQAASDPNNFLNKYPQDYMLMYVGEFDDQTGRYQNVEAPTSLGTAAALLAKVEVKQ